MDDKVSKIQEYLLKDRPQGIFFCDVCGQAHKKEEQSFIVLIGGFLNGIEFPVSKYLKPITEDGKENVFVVCKTFACLIRFFFSILKIK